MTSGGHNRLPTGEAAIRNLFSNFQIKAKNRDIPWHLTLPQVTLLISSPCYYCGDLPSQSWGAWRGSAFNGSILYNGIDRVNSTGGYDMENVVSCCWKCNRAKGDMSQSEFYQSVRKIYRRRCDNNE